MIFFYKHVLKFLAYMAKGCKILNKSNSTAGAVQVEANLLWTSTVTAQFTLQMHNKQHV